MSMAMERRQALGLIGAGAMVAATRPAAGAKEPPSRARKFDLANPADRFEAYIKMRGATDDRLVISYISGSYFGIVGSEVTPLWDVVGATFVRFRRRPDGIYDVASGEIAHFLDPKTGEAAGEFLIPYTGKIAKDPRTNLPPNHFVLKPTLHLEVPKMPAGTVMDHDIREPEVRGNDIWFNELTRVAMPIPGLSTPFRYSEMVTMQAHISDLENPELARVPTTANFSNVVAWRPWMNMGDHAGHLMAVGTGRYGVTMDLLPENWTKATRDQFPDLLDDPSALLAPVWNNILAG